QMLGKTIIDKMSVESEYSEMEGLGLLNCTTYFDKYEKSTIQVEGHLHTDPKKRMIRGYEIHMGQTENSGNPPLCRIRRDGRKHDEGAYDIEKKVFGTYLHGFFDLPPGRELLLSMTGKAGPRADERRERDNMDLSIELNLEILAREVKRAVDINKIMEIMGV
ncbi:MAG: hypothetical protein JW825_00175, partial [Candidatus Methanofastidiosa archaeon]|nr:hypothetical protein [Candidatus Methanofastidiosa archaeon]